MQNQENKIAANKRLAELLGWSSLAEVNGALVGSPPAGAAESRGQALVPDWAGDWAAAGPLSTEHEIDLLHNWSSVNAVWAHGKQAREVFETEIDNRDDGTRLAIVRAVIAKLEAGQ